METREKEEKRNKKIEIRLTELEKELIQLRAEAANYPSISSYLRVLAKTGMVINIEFKEILPFMTAVDRIANEIHRIGVNENQLAKKANENNSWTYHESNLHLTILNELEELTKRLEKLNKYLIPFWEKADNLMEHITNGSR